MVDNETIAKLLKSIEDTNKRSIEEANQNQTKDIKEHINNEIAELKAKFEQELIKKTENYEAKYNELKENQANIERELRKNNIVIFGLEAPSEDLPNFVIEKLSHLLQVQISLFDINNVYTFGKQADKKPILLKLTTYLKKQEILRNCKKLKGTPISISEEFSPEERKENKILRQHLKLARSKNLNAIIRNRKLFINDQQYTVQQLLAEVDEDDNLGEINNINSEINQQVTENLPTTKHTLKPNSAPSTPNEARKTKEIEGEEEPDFETEK